MLSSVGDAKEVLGQMAFCNDLNDINRDIILDTKKTFWTNLSMCIAIISPICDRIAIVESDSSNISEVPILFNELFEFVNSSEQTAITNEVR